MADVKRCDVCHVLDGSGAAVKPESWYVALFSDKDPNLNITVPLPPAYRHKDLCGDCRTDAIRASFVELCAILSPYQPKRRAGFIQAEQRPEESLTKAERDALAVLSQRLLKA